MPVFALQDTPRTIPAAQLICFHCHEECPDDRLRLGDKHFCCTGCKTVFEILDTHQMCAYYDLDQTPGRRVAHQAAAKAYAYLDDSEIAQQLIEFETGNIAQATFFMPQMHCVSCIWLLENLHRLDKGVTHARVNFLKKTTTLQFDKKQTTLRQVVALLASIGYEPNIKLGDTEGKRPINRRLAYQLGVAGFAFGNIMLLSFPEYVGMSRTVDPKFAQFFGYLSLVLALPVLLFSARDYFVSAWHGLRQGWLNIDIPLCLALSSLFFRSVWEILTQTGAGYLDSFAGLTFLLFIGKWFQQRTWSLLSFERDYKSYFPVAATVRKGQEERSVPVRQLAPGDIIVVRNNEIVPADGVLLDGMAQLDYSFVTGESVPVAVQQGERIFAGGKQIGASIEIALLKRVAQSHLTQLWNNEAFKANTKGQVSQLADAAGRWFTLLILAFGGGAFLYWWMVRHDMATAINAFTAVMIVACPCTVALSIPFTLGNVQRLLGRRGLYLKNIRVVEAFKGITAVVFDKTGTITTVSDGQWTAINGSFSKEDMQLVRSAVRHSSHPLSRQMYAAWPDVPTVALDYFEETPGLGIEARALGKTVRVGSANFVAGTEHGLPAAQIAALASIDGRVVGWFETSPSLRPALEGVVRHFEHNGCANNLYVLSGDHDRDAAMLAPYFGQKEHLLFQQSPQGKLDFVKKLQAQGHKVLMLGDGLNDAGALQQSDLGIVVSEHTNNFTPACDAILRADTFGELPQMATLARAGVRIVNQSYAVALTYNAVGLYFAVSGTLSPLVAAVLMPISSVSIVLFGMGLSSYQNYKQH